MMIPPSLLGVSATTVVVCGLAQLLQWVPVVVARPVCWEGHSSFLNGTSVCVVLRVMLALQTAQTVVA